MATDEVKAVATETKRAAAKIVAAPVLTDETKIEVKSLIPNVIYSCTTTFEDFEWLEAGDVQDMTYRQLKIMKSKHPRYFTEKWLMPCNEAAIKALKLQEIYSNKITKADIEVFYGSDLTAAEKIIKGASAEGLEKLREKIEADTKAGKIANVKMIRLLESQLGIDLMQFV